MFKDWAIILLQLGDEDIITGEPQFRYVCLGAIFDEPDITKAAEQTEALLNSIGYQVENREYKIGEPDFEGPDCDKHEGIDYTIYDETIGNAVVMLNSYSPEKVKEIYDTLYYKNVHNRE